MLQTLIWVLLPLFLGFAIPLKNRKLIKLVDHSLIALIYVILFIMGLNLSLIPDLWTQLQSIFGKTAVFIICILGLNMIALLILDKKLPYHVKGEKPQKESRLFKRRGSFQSGCISQVE